MRIAIVHWTRAVVGGAERYLRALVPRLLEKGHELSIAFETDAWAGSPAIDPPGSDLAKWQIDPSRVADAVCVVRAWNPDVVYMHGLQSVALETALVRVAPSVIFLHGHYGTCATGQKRHTRPRIVACTRTFGIPCLAVNYLRGCGSRSPVGLARFYRSQRGRAALFPHFRELMVASQYMRTEYLRHGVAAERLHVVHLPPTDLAPDGVPPAPRGVSGRVLFLSRLDKLKGGAHLVPAIALASAALGRSLSLVVAGAGQEESRLRSLAQRLGVSAEFTGFVDGERRLDLLRAADVVAVPSLFPEPFGLTGIEAGCVGVPAVAYDFGGVREWLDPGISGEVAAADPPTPEGLAQALARALSDHGHYTALRRGAWETARRFSMDKHLEVLLTLLATAAGGTSPGGVPAREVT